MTAVPLRVRLLIADDQPLHLKMLERAIAEAAGETQVEFVRAGDGDEAAAALASGVDGAFLDMRMPRRSGLQILDEFGGPKHVPRIPVVIVSSSLDRVEMDKARDLGAIDYVAKQRYPEFQRAVAGALEKVLHHKPL